MDLFAVNRHEDSGWCRTFIMTNARQCGFLRFLVAKNLRCRCSVAARGLFLVTSAFVEDGGGRGGVVARWPRLTLRPICTEVFL